MSNLAPSQSHERVLPAIVLGVIGYHVFIVQPGFVAGLVGYGGLSESQAGYVAAAEMAGIAATTILMMWLMRHMSWRLLAGVGLVLVAGGNFACVGLSTVTSLSVARLVVGTGSGGLLALSYAWLGLSRRPERNFGIFLTAVLSYGALGLVCLPTALARLGLGGVLIILAMLGVAGLLLLPQVSTPRADACAVTVSQGHEPALRSRLLALVAVLAYFIAQGIVWPYLALIGIERGIGDQAVARGLMIAQFLGIAGALSASYVTQRVSHFRALGLAIVFGALPLITLESAAGASQYDLSASIFNFFSNLVTPLFMAIMARLDSTARLVSQAVAITMVGLAAGPALGAALVGAHGYALAIYTSVALFMGSLLAIAPVFLLHPIRREVVPR